MTLPVETLKRRPPAASCDVVVVGAGLAGLVCATALATAGRRVVVVDRSKRPGGRLQTVNHQGFAVDLGPVVWESSIVEVLEAAGVADHGLVPLSPRDSIRLSVVGDDGTTGAPLALPVPGAVPAPSTLDAIRKLYEAPPRLFAGLGEIYDEWSGATPAQLDEWRDMDVSTWLEERAFEPSLATAVARSAVLLGGAPDASLVVLAGLAQSLAEGAPTHVTIGDTPVAGARGVVQALVDLFIEAGGELRLGTAAVGLGLDDGRFSRVAMRREETPFIEELEADRCVFAIPPAELRTLLPPEPRAALDRLSPEQPAHRELAVAWAIDGDLAPPGGKEGEEPALVRLIAASRAKLDVASVAGGSFVWSTVAAPRLAPRGRALLRASLPVAADDATDVDVLERRVAALRQAAVGLVPDVLDRVVWEHRWIGAHPLETPLRLPRLPLLAPGLSGALLASQEVAVAGGTATGVAAAALAGRTAAERILAEGTGRASADGDGPGETDAEPEEASAEPAT